MSGYKHEYKGTLVTSCRTDNAGCSSYDSVAGRRYREPTKATLEMMAPGASITISGECVPGLEAGRRYKITIEEEAPTAKELADRIPVNDEKTRWKLDEVLREWENERRRC